jgi:hypothetical protein
LDVLHDQVAGVEALGIGIGFGVLQETEQVLSGLDGPAGLGDTEWLAWGRVSGDAQSLSSIKIVQFEDPSSHSKTTSTLNVFHHSNPPLLSISYSKHPTPQQAKGKS